MDATSDLARERSEFIEKIGLAAQADGMPRIAGRLMGLMVFDGTSYSFSQLAEELQISRGSVSSNARLLEERGVIERVTKPGDRQDYFRLADNPYEAVLRGAVERSRRASMAIQKSIDRLPDGNDPIRKRLTDYRVFYDAIVDGVSKVANELTK